MDQSARTTNIISRAKLTMGVNIIQHRFFTKTSPISHRSGEQWNHCSEKESINLSNLKFCWHSSQDIAFQWPTWVCVKSITSPIIAAAPENKHWICEPLLTCKTVEDIKRTDFDNYAADYFHKAWIRTEAQGFIHCWCNVILAKNDDARTWLQTPSKRLSNFAQ